MDTKKTALLVMDMQMGIVSRLPEQGAAVVNKAAEAIATARANNVLVIIVRLGFHKGLPEVSDANKMFATAKAQLSTNNNNLEAFMQLHPNLGVTEDDIIINKRRVSAFSGNELDMLLCSQNITHLVLSGVSTSGIVLSTVREAADKDYELTVLSDGCADSSEENHHFLLEKIFPRQAEVMTIDEWKTKNS